MRATLNEISSGGGRRASGPGNGRYLAVAALLVALVGLLYGGAWWLTHAGPADPPATATTILSTPPAAAAPATASPAPTRVRPTSWTVTEVTDPRTGRGYYMAPPEVVAMVLEDRQAMDSYFREHTYDLSESDLRMFLAEPEFSTAVKMLEERRARGEARGRAALESSNTRVLEFGSDGLTAQVAEEFNGESIPTFDLRSGARLREDRAPIGTGISTMLYDAEGSRWKSSGSRFVPRE